MSQFTTEQLLNDLSRVSVVDSTAFLAGPAVTAVIAAGGTLANAAYFYKVTAVNVYGESTPGAEGTATSASTNQTANLSWTAVTGATSYNVYRGTVTNTENKLIASVTTNSFSDTGITGTTLTPPAANTAAVVPDPGVPSGQKALVVQRLNKFLSGSTVALYKRAGTNPVNEVGTIAVPNQSYAAGVYRLKLDVLSLGSYPADYNRWAINKGKPFYIEVNLATTAANGNVFTAAIFPQLLSGLKKSNGSVIQDVVITDVASGTTGTITITAASEYLRFREIKLEIFAADPVITTEFYFQDLLTGTVTTAGAEGFGTSWFLNKNFRIPTDEAIRWMGLDQDERPINGVLYNQYTLAYEAKRNIGTQDIVGGVGTSHTDHIFYVPTTVASTFESNISSAFGATFMTTIV